MTEPQPPIPEPHDMVLGDVIATLASGDVEGLLGCREGTQIDFKGQAYDLRSPSPKGARDLAADVAAFANAQGGAIVLGVRTTISGTSLSEVASEIAGVKPSAISEEQIRKIVGEHIHPNVEDLRLRSFPISDERQVAMIEVPAQKDGIGPFLVDRLPDADRERDLPHAVGWPIRAGSETRWESLAHIQQQLSMSRLFQRSRSMATQSREAPMSAVARRGDDLRFLDTLLARRPDDWQGRPLYILRVSPVNPARRVEDFYGAFREDLGSWRGLRSAGFNLNLSWAELEPIEDWLADVVSRTGVLVHRDGTVVSVAVGSEDFLGWSSQRADAEHLEVNPWVICEFTLETLRLAMDFIGPKVAASCWRMDFVGRDFGGTPKLYIGRGTNFGPRGWGHRHDATTLTPEGFIEGGPDTMEAALGILREVYGTAFGLGHDAVPFQRDGRIDPDLIAGD